MGSKLLYEEGKSIKLKKQKKTFDRKQTRRGSASSRFGTDQSNFGKGDATGSKRKTKYGHTNIESSCRETSEGKTPFTAMVIDVDKSPMPALSNDMNTLTKNEGNMTNVSSAQISINHPRGSNQSGQNFGEGI